MEIAITVLDIGLVEVDEILQGLGGTLVGLGGVGVVEAHLNGDDGLVVEPGIQASGGVDIHKDVVIGNNRGVGGGHIDVIIAGIISQQIQRQGGGGAVAVGGGDGDVELLVQVAVRVNAHPFRIQIREQNLIGIRALFNLQLNNSSPNAEGQHIGGDGHSLQIAGHIVRRRIDVAVIQNQGIAQIGVQLPIGVLEGEIAAVNGRSRPCARNTTNIFWASDVVLVAIGAILQGDAADLRQGIILFIGTNFGGGVASLVIETDKNRILTVFSEFDNTICHRISVGISKCTSQITIAIQNFTIDLCDIPIARCKLAFGQIHTEVNLARIAGGNHRFQIICIIAIGGIAVVYLPEEQLAHASLVDGGIGNSADGQLGIRTGPIVLGLHRQGEGGALVIHNKLLEGGFLLRLVAGQVCGHHLHGALKAIL